MPPLTFDQVAPDRWAGIQPDGRIVGFIRRSRRKDPRWAFEAVLRFADADDHNHCGYGDTPDAAKRLLVTGLKHRCERFVYQPEEY